MKRLLYWLLALAALAVVPFVLTSRYQMLIVDMMLINGLGVLGLQLIYSYTGQLSIAQGAFFGIGAYTTALLTTRLGVPVFPAIAAGTLIAGLCTLLMSPLVRLRGHFFAVATFAFAQMTFIVLNNWVRLTGGPGGVTRIPPVSVFGYTLTTAQTLYPVLAACAVLCYWFVERLVTGRFGRSLTSIRENEVASAAVGINPATVKMKAIFIGGAISGLGGALFAHLIRYVSPTNFTFELSILFLMMVVAGGRHPFGAFLGAGLLTMLPELLRDVPGYEKYPALRMIVFGLLLLLIIAFLPRGIASLNLNFWRRRKEGAA